MKTKGAPISQQRRRRKRGDNARREPRQWRARQTVEAVLDAAIRVLKRQGADAITTNRIAEVAGVSIGSVYQYFPDKRAIFAALHERHVGEIDRLVQTKLIEHANSPLKELVRAMVDAMVEAHAADPELHELLSTQVPHRTDNGEEFEVRLDRAFRLAIAAKREELPKGHDLDKTVWVVTHMVDALSHGAVLRRPKGMSLEEAKAEAARAVMRYLQG